MTSVRGRKLDLAANVKYDPSDEELKAHESANAKMDQDEDTTRKEFIFFIDRSDSMKHTIELAREALILFLYSLPAGSKFNICSYGKGQ